MTEPERELVNKVAQTCIDLYNKLPKTGKPTANEWTVLSCVVKYEKDRSNIEVVSLGSGSKCIGASKMSPNGDILNDSHAEVMARRGFLLYLYNQIEQVVAKKPSIFVVENDKYMLRRDSIDFLFYSSQLPCGDASIIPKMGHQEHFGDVIKTQKRTADRDICETDTKTIKTSEDTHRTGAKCLPDAVQDSKNPGLDYHLLGQVRTKPGRGDHTLSVSCSDKLSRWTHVGIQGSLLDMLLVEPIFIKYYVFGALVPFSKEALCRALLERKPGLTIAPVLPNFYQSTIIFPHIRREENVRPAATSIVWIKKDNPLIEVAVLGKKLGVTKKNINELTSALSISKVHLYKKFLQILNQNLDLKQMITQEELLDRIPYNEMKKKSRRYVEKWMVVRDQFFRMWTVKPDMWSFCVRN